MKKYSVSESTKLDLSVLCSQGINHYENFKRLNLSTNPLVSKEAANGRKDLRFVYTDPPFKNEYGISCRLVILFSIQKTPVIDTGTGAILEYGLVEIKRIQVNKY